MSLPKWKCHKIVEADQIVEIKYGIDGARWHLKCGIVIAPIVTAKLTQRGAPKVNDFYVRYNDGYESWSPRQAFEEGYALLEPEDVDGQRG